MIHLHGCLSCQLSVPRRITDSQSPRYVIVIICSDHRLGCLCRQSRLIRRELTIILNRELQVKITEGSNGYAVITSELNRELQIKITEGSNGYAVIRELNRELQVKIYNGSKGYAVLDHISSSLRTDL